MKHLKFVDLRKRIGTQEEFAKLINSSRYCVSKWEKGENLPKTKVTPIEMLKGKR